MPSLSESGFTGRVMGVPLVPRVALFAASPATAECLRSSGFSLQSLTQCLNLDSLDYWIIWIDSVLRGILPVEIVIKVFKLGSFEENSLPWSLTLTWKLRMI
jgi:hypothetical protein